MVKICKCFIFEKNIPSAIVACEWKKEDKKRVFRVYWKKHSANKRTSSGGKISHGIRGGIPNSCRRTDGMGCPELVAIFTSNRTQCMILNLRTSLFLFLLPSRKRNCFHIFERNIGNMKYFPFNLISSTSNAKLLKSRSNWNLNKIPSLSLFYNRNKFLSS